MTFLNAVETHLKAIKERNLESYLGTISKSDVTVILPSGQVIEGYKAVEKLHRDWFQDTDWRMDYKVVKTLETSSMGIILLDIDYVDLDQNGAEYRMHYYLTLTFRKEKGEWKLIFDQNTIIK